MNAFLSNRYVRIAGKLALFGWTPLFLILVLDALGLWPDPNPNPIGPGLLFLLSFVAAIICLGIGAVQTWRDRS